MPKYGRAVVVLNMVIEPNAIANTGQDIGKRQPADLQRIATQIVAVQLNQVERVQEHAGVVAAVTDAIEAGHTLIVAGDRLAIDDAGPRAQPSQGLHDQREAAGQVIAGAAVEPNPRAVLTGDDPEAVVFDFMQPQRPGRRMLGFCGQARRDELGREGTLQHAD
jgi:hypothetical protein